MAQLSLWQLCIAGLSCLRPGRWEGAGRSEVWVQQARGYITAPLGHASYHAGVRLGSEGRDFALRAGRGPDIWLDKSSSIYQTGKQKGRECKGRGVRLAETESRCTAAESNCFWTVSAAEPALSTKSKPS